MAGAGLIVLLLAALALGQAPLPEPAEDEPQTVDEIIVWGPLAVREARSMLVTALEAEGWRIGGRREGVIIFHPPRRWMGKARLHEDGRIDFTRPVLIPKEAGVNDYGGYGEYGGAERDVQLVDLVSEEDVAAGDAPSDRLGAPMYRIVPKLGLYFLPRRGLLEQVRADLLRAVGSEHRHYNAVVVETAHKETLLALPDRLDALWADGVPLDPRGAPLATLAERRAAVLDYWATRTSTRQGDELARAAEVWLDATVQDSDAPVTAEEAAAAEARRVDGRRLVLTFPSPTP